MLLIFFEKNYFLLALGWGIINSIWQAGALWILYKLISSAKDTPAVFKYHLSTISLSISFCWFIVTTIQGCLAIQGGGYSSLIDINLQWTLFYQRFSSLFQLISSAYLLLLLIYSIKFSRRFSHLFALKNSEFIKAPAHVRIFVNETAAHIGIPRKVKVWLSKNVEVPCVTGYFKPLILLPFSAINNLSTSQVEAIILHELAHIKRNDYLVNLVQSFMELILFFNPFALLLGKAARKERENCCDDWVLNYRYNKHDYATALMMLEAKRQQPLQLAIAATNDKKQLLIRIKRLFIVSPVTAVNHWQRFKLAGISLAVLILFITFLPSIHSKQPAAEFNATIPTAKMLNNPRQAVFINTAANTAEDAHSKKITNDQLVAVNNLVKISKKEVQKSIQKKIKEVEYSETLINEELLKVNQELQHLAVQAADKELVPEQTYFIKVEEEISGSKEKKSYLLEYNKVDGKVEVKPLIILKKTKTKIASPNTKVNKAKATRVAHTSRKKMTS